MCQSLVTVLVVENDFFMGSFFEREATSEPPVSEERSSCVSELATTWRSTVPLKGEGSPLQDSRLDTAHRGSTTQTGEPWSIGRSDPPHIVPR